MSEKRPVNSRWIRRLVGYCWQERRGVLLALGGAIATSAATLVIPLLQRNIIDHVVLARHPASLWPLAVGLAIAAAVNFAGIYLRRYHGGRVALDVQHRLRTALFGSLHYGKARVDPDMPRASEGELERRDVADLTSAAECPKTRSLQPEMCSIGVLPTSSRNTERCAVS